MKGWKPKDIAVMALTITLCITLIIAMTGAVFNENGDGRIEELVAFLLGSIVTIVGEYILLHLKFGKIDESQDDKEKPSEDVD